jgi:opacity protein-like surface antigen
MSFRRTLALTLLLALSAPTAAWADGLIVPFIGYNFAGNSGKELSDAIDAERVNWGVSLAYMGGGVLGLEADIGYSPDFFGKTDLGGSSVLTMMGNLLIGIPIGGQSGVGFRPYVLGGLGLVRSQVDAFSDVASLDNSEFGWSFGGGAMFFFGDAVGLRADLRYFRTFGEVDFDLEDGIVRREQVDFARASAGLILRF